MIASLLALATCCSAAPPTLPISRAELTRRLSELGADDSHLSVCMHLYDELVEDLEEARVSFEARLATLAAAREGPPNETGGNYQLDLTEVAAIGEWRARQSELLSDFERSMRSAWPSASHDQCAAFFREIRRERALPAMQGHAGARAAWDLVAIIDSLVLSDAERLRLAPTVSQYELMLDEQLIPGEEEILAMEFEIIRLQTLEPTARARNPRWLMLENRVRNRASAIGELNRHFVGVLGEQLSDDARSRLLAAVSEATYPLLHKPSPADLAIRMIRDLPWLAEDQRAALEAVHVDYQVERDALREHLIRSLEGWETPREIDRRRELRGEYLAAGRNPGEILEANPVRDWLRLRRAAAIAALRRMSALFTPDQLERIPSGLRVVFLWGDSAGTP